MSEVFEVEARTRKRKPNFSQNEIAVLTEKVLENIDTLQAKLTNIVTNKKKKFQWDEIANAVNVVGHAMRSTQEVREKWKNLQSTAKKEFQQFRREKGKTGGGPAPTEPTTASRAIIDVLEEQPSFSGLHGFEAAVGEWCQVM